MKPNPTQHPSAFISREDAEAIRRFSAVAERLGCLLPDQLALIYARNWFNIYVPSCYGGLEMALSEGLRLQEALAWADGSLGWTVTLCSGANWFIGFLQPALARELFSDPKVCLAGSGRPSGVAKEVSDGHYEIDGRWKYATGAPHATAFTASCLIEKDGAPLRDAEGGSGTRAFLFLAREVAIIEDWAATGMIATASHSFYVQHLPVPSSRSFLIDQRHARLPQPIYRIPFMAFAEATLAVNSSGMAARFLDLAGEIFAQRADDDQSNRRQRSERLLRTTRDRLQSARQDFYLAVDASSDAIGIASRRLAATALRVVDELYPSCGLIAATPGSEINRVWRDLHTASQHGLLLT